MSNLDEMVAQGEARMRYRVELAIWRHTPAFHYDPQGMHSATGLDLCMLYRPEWPRCPNCTPPQQEDKR